MIRREFIKIVIPLVTIGPSIPLLTSQPQLRFGVIADPQYADKNTNGSRFYRASLDKLQMAIEELNKESLDFVVTLGDLIDQDLESYSDILPIYDKLKTAHHIVVGNHDFDVDDADKGEVLGRLGLEKSYYSKAQSGWRLIFLDGTEESLFRYAEGSEEKNKYKQILEELKLRKVPHAQPWNGGMSNIQMDWLKQELEGAKTANEKVILCNHYPVMPINDPHNMWNDEALVSLLAEYENVILYMNGHNHAGNYAVHKGTHYVNFKGMVETATESAFAIVSCYSDRVEVQGFGLEPDRNLSQ